MTANMEMVEHAKKGSLIIINENFHIYYFNKINKLTEEQKLNKNHNENDMFDILVNISTRPQIRHDTQGV
jgi:hypothetical protein